MRKSKLRSDRVASSPSHKSVTAAVTKTKSTISHQRKVAPPRSKVVHKEEVPVPKSRRVLPEHEGKYKITMPSGSTPKTARLLAEGKLMVQLIFLDFYQNLLMVTTAQLATMMYMAIQ